ncbi:MAG TPA: DUF1259 domain-containing protein [Gemmatimonadaceae bacterium]
MTKDRLSVAGFSLLLLTTCGASLTAQGNLKPTDRDPRWSAIRRVFGQQGEAHDGYFRVNLPRSDLSVRIGDDVLESPFEFTSYIGFVPVGTNDVLAMGEYVLRDDEVATVMGELRRQGISTPALHNHLIGESPRIMYIHVMVRGPAESVATKLKSAFEKSATPMKPEAESPSNTDWSTVDAILGKHSEAKGHVAEYELPRHEHLTIDGIAVKSSGMLETASEVVFQQLGSRRAACGGELFVSPNEIDAVARALEEHGLHVTAIHNHMVDQTPHLYWMHWYGTGDASTLARGVAAALEHTNGARKSASEE